MKRMVMMAVAIVVGFVVSAVAADDVVIETGKFTLTIGADAKAKSLKVKVTGEEMLDVHEGLPAFSVTQDRPFNNEIKLVFPHYETVFNANRVRREGEFLIVGFELISYEAKIRVLERDGYAIFELVDFILGPKGTDHLKMTYPPVKSFRMVNLPVRSRERFGDWMNVVWDDAAGVAVMAGEPYTWIQSERRHGFHLMFADARRDLKLRGAKAVLVADASGSLLDDVDSMERELGLPLGVESRRSPYMNRSVYWTSFCTPKNVDQHIAMVKKGGFKMLLMYYTSVCKGAQGDWSYGGIGDYELHDEYVKGLDSLKEMLNKIKAAGITPGLHVLQTFIGFKSGYVTPVADPRLNLTRHFTLARGIGEDGGDLLVQEDPSNCPTNIESRVLAFGGELMSYESFTIERPFKFTGVKRGHLKTRVVAHPRGQIGGILDVCEYGARSCYIDQNSDLQDEIAAKIARIYNCGYQFMYCDGSEGVNVPQGIHVPNAQYRVWKQLDPKPVYMEGAAKAHFGWHHLSAANAFDVFHPEIFKEMIVRWPQYEAPIIKADFSRPDFGWWGVYLPGQELKREGIVTIGTQPDMWEFGDSRAAAWDAPISIQMKLELLNKHPRLDDLMEVKRRWEDVREKNWLTAEMKERLKSKTQEHHLYVNAKGEYELHDITMLPTPAAASKLRGFVFEREGRRMICYWHTSGSGKVTFSLGENGEPISVVADKMCYIETRLSAKEVAAAFAAAVMEETK